jgi:hypothetical protein
MRPLQLVWRDVSRATLTAAAVTAVLMSACSGPLQGAPSFQQTYGTVDPPCGISTRATVSHCTAHVYLVNNGGEGIGHATIVVTLKAGSAAATAARLSPVKCGIAIPDTSAGGEVDLTCGFDLPAGTAIAAAPILQSVDFAGATKSGSSGGGLTEAVTLVIALIAALTAVVALVVAVARRRPVAAAVSPALDAARRQPTQAEPDEGDNW